MEWDTNCNNLVITVVGFMGDFICGNVANNVKTLLKYGITHQ